MIIPIHDEKTMKFHAWLKRYRNQENAIGDLARDALRDPEAPTKGGIRAWRTHLKTLGACDAAKATLERAWKQYQMEMVEGKIVSTLDQWIIYAQEMRCAYCTTSIYNKRDFMERFTWEDFIRQIWWEHDIHENAIPEPSDDYFETECDYCNSCYYFCRND